MDKLEWYFVDANGEQAGPLVGNDFIAAFASKAFDESSLCWNETLDEWSPVSSIPGLLTYLKPAPKAPAGRPGPKAPPARSPSVPTSAAEPVAATPSSPKASTGPKKESKLVSALDKANQIAMQRGGWKEMKTADGGEYYLNIVTEEVTWDKPRELETVAEQAREGDWYWLPDPVEAFIPGKKVNTTKDKVQFEKEHGGFVYLSLNEAKSLERMQWSQLKTKTNDLVMLDVMNPPLIMYNLKMRFQENEIYTNVGTILISCNPYKRLPLYTPQVLDSYMKKGSRKMPPHVYNIADDAFRNLREWSQAQSIVISGESGAGKTECTKQALEYLAEIAGSGTSSVEQKLLSSNPILEAFGNAKTVRNNNSSRFGKYVEIYFNNRNQIAGASVTNYLLEKIRVCMQSPGERNYHIFFQLILGASEDTKRNLRLTDASRFFYLNQSGSTEVDGVDDVNDFADMDNAMNVMGFTAAEKDQVFKCTACVLHIGNIEFKSAGDRKCEVKNSAMLRDVATLMQVDEKELSKVVTTRTIKVPGQKPIESGMAPLEACAARDALAKFIYSSQFDWLVNRICEAIGRGESARGRTIGILDIFGFEIFAKNQFEQLCINFANEKLQQFFNAHTFKKEEEVYAYERIQYEHVEYIDNQPVLDLIEKKQGILLLIDEEIKVPKGDDRTLMAKLTKVHGATAEFVKIMKRPQNFCVKHYAGQVEYETEGFLEKNKDKLADDQYSCLTASKFPFLASLFPANSDAASDKKTLGAKFAGQLNALMSALNATEPHYIRCIKPNPRKAPMEFEGMMSMLQLRYSGVFEAVKIRKQGYPFRLTHREFWLRYKCIMPQTHQWSGNVLDNVRFLVREMKQDANAVQIGTTKILYRAKQHKDMELRRNLAVEQVAIFIQKYSRRALAKQLEQRVKMIRPVIAKAIASRSIEQVKEALKRAANVGYDTTEILEAKRMLFVFEEEQRLEGVFAVLCSQDPHQYFDQFAAAVASADDIKLQSPSANQCREIHAEACAVRAQIDTDAQAQTKILDEDAMADVITRAADINYVCDAVNTLRTYLYEYSEDRFVKMQLQAAVAFKDVERITKKTIRLKELFFAKSADMFRFHKYNQLLSMEEWASLKFFTMNRDLLAMGMLKATADSIHAPLCNITDKLALKAAPKVFKNIQGYMGDRKLQFPDVLAVDLIKSCLEMKQLRDEVYCQIIKQLTENPNPTSVSRGWNLMLLCLHSFPPNGQFENFLECYIRDFAPEPRAKYIYKMHTTLYGGAKQVAPDVSELATILAYVPPEDEKKSAANAAQPEAEEQAPAPAPKARGSAPAPKAAPKAAPKMDETVEWFYLDGEGTQQGPVCVSDLKAAYQAGSAKADSLVWNENLEGWVTLDSLEDLMAFVSA